MKYRICVLYSGSGGNATLIETPSARILIDGGKNCKKLTEALAAVGSAPEQVQAIFVTHEHFDHVKALPVFCKKYRTPVHMVRASAERLSASDASALGAYLRTHEEKYAVTVGDLTVISFPIPHDSACCVGYRIFIKQGEETANIGYATDIGCVTPLIRDGLLLGCESVVLESNHDVPMLLACSYSFDVKVRVRGEGGHLSNEESAKLAAYLADRGMKRLILAHLSRENNTPDLALLTHRQALGPRQVELLAADAELPVCVCVEEPVC